MNYNEHSSSFNLRHCSKAKSQVLCPKELALYENLLDSDIQYMAGHNTRLKRLP